MKSPIPSARVSRPLTACSLAALLALFAPDGGARAEGEGPEAVITGTVTYLQHVALPPDAIVMVALQEISLADGRVKVIAEQKFPTAGKQVPIPFNLAYQVADIDPARTYVLRATISSDGRLRFASNMSNRILTHGTGTKLDIVLQQIGGGVGPARPEPRQSQPPAAQPHW